MSITDKFNLAAEKIKQAERILVIGHLRPDGDALASCSAVLEISQRFSKEAWGFCDGLLPSNFDFLPNFNRLKSSVTDLKQAVPALQTHDQWLDYFDLVFILDCGSLSRTALSKEIKNSQANQRPFIIEIDHHPAVDHYANLEIRNSQASSTTEIIYDFWKFLNLPLDKKIADCLLTGIITDTGNFFYPNASAKSLAIASELLMLGANLPKLIKSSTTNKNLATFKLWGLAMDRLQINQKYDFAFSVVTLDDLNSLSADAEEISEALASVAGFLSNLSEVKITLLLHETSSGMIKGHLRTADSKADVSKLARFLGGGGHTQASGFALAAQLKVTANKVWVE